MYPGPRLEVGAPVRLFRLDTGIDNYDVTPDGARFLVTTSPEKSRESPIRVIVNWPAALEKEK